MGEKSTHGQVLLQLALVAYMSLLAAAQKGDGKFLHIDVHTGQDISSPCLSGQHRSREALSEAARSISGKRERVTVWSFVLVPEEGVGKRERGRGSATARLAALLRVLIPSSSQHVTCHSSPCSETSL